MASTARARYLPTAGFKTGPFMSEVLPDRLAADPDSPYYDAEILQRGVGVRFKGADKTNVEEYCVSEGWVRLTVGSTVNRAGKPMTIKLQGPVEPYFRDSE
jgi:Protein of unknown function (DUF3297)